MKVLILILVALRFYTLALIALMFWVAWDIAKWVMKIADKQANKSKRVL